MHFISIDLAVVIFIGLIGALIAGKVLDLLVETTGNNMSLTKVDWTLFVGKSVLVVAIVITIVYFLTAAILH